LKGEKVYEELQKICTANIKKEIGRCTYTQMLNSDGGIETDLTVACLSDDHYTNVELIDVTDDYVCLGLFGPKSRVLIQEISGDDFSNEKLKFGYSKNILIENC